MGNIFDEQCATKWNIMLFCHFDCLSRFMHFGENFWPALLDRERPSTFSALQDVGGSDGPSQATGEELTEEEMTELQDALVVIKEEDNSLEMKDLLELLLGDLHPVES